MHAPQIFYLIYSLFTIIYSLILRTLPYSIILWAVHASDWQLALLQREQQQPTTSAGVSPKTTTQNHHPSHHTSSAHLRVLRALCVPTLRTSSASHSHHARDSQYTLILKNHLGAPARTTPGCSEIIESCITHTQHLATTRAHSIRTNPNKIIVNPVKNFARLATTFTQVLI